MAKPTFPVASNDFYKTNGVDARTFNTEPSMARQEFAEECDINSLMKRYEGHATGGPSGLQMMGDPSKMFYADFTIMPSSLQEFHSFMDTAQAAFMSLPAVVRKEFDNDATMFVDFASDADNLAQMRTWGLAPPEKVEAPPQKVEVVGGLGGVSSPPEPAEAVKKAK